ncbi:MAG: GNAT family N-acetyltransferase, partial [Maribacter sp.]|nr:GNAT family N-acetyltransferase [Maribacter sp.]
MTYKILHKEDVTPALKVQIRDLFKTLNADINQLNVDTILAQGNEFICACCWENEK